jgi:excisionase family DNA binding protein
MGTFGTNAFEETLCRDLAQGIAQMGAADMKPLTVFVSHTKRLSTLEESSVSSLVDLVRDVISNTRLREFFDAHDLQPNEDWAPALVAAASTGALLAVRTDLYSSRPWCQREVLTAKRAGMPVVILDALTVGEERGSFVMDHVPRSPGRHDADVWRREDIVRVLGQLVDECLKRVLWRKQQAIAAATGLPVDVDWWAPHAPEPATFAAWLDGLDDLAAKRSEPIVVLHPDPPLGPDERGVLVQIARLAKPAHKRRGLEMADSLDEPQRLFDDADFCRLAGGPANGSGQDGDQRSDATGERKAVMSNGKKTVGRDRPDAVRPRASRGVRIAVARQSPPRSGGWCEPDVPQSPSSSVEDRRPVGCESTTSEADADPAAPRPRDESSADIAPRLVTILRAAELLGVGRTTGYELVAAGELEVVHIGRSARIPIASIDAYVLRLRESARPPRRGLRVRMRE